MFSNHLLSWMIWLPTVGAILCLLASAEGTPSIYPRIIAVITALADVFLCIPLYHNFDLSSAAMQFKEDALWIPAYGIHYALGVDGLSAGLIILTTLTTLVVILAGCTSIHKKIAQYMATFLITQTMVIGVFASLDSILFYVFWEGMLIPMYLSIGIWGSANRSYASIKFFIYTFFGSALMLVVILYLYRQSGSFLITDFYKLPISRAEQIWLFIGFTLAFMVKVPMWPTHTWLPDAHTAAPSGGSVVLAALMLKLGTYGFFRFSLPIVPDACRSLANVMIILSLISIVYIGLVAIVQRDMKRLIAYSSIAHMGFVTLGCFAIYSIMQTSRDWQFAYLAFQGAMFQMIAHAFSAGAMFIAAGILYDQMHTHELSAFGGIAKKMPVLAGFFMLFALSNLGLPGTSGFVGEFLIFLSLFKANFWVLLVSGTAIVLSAVYTLWMYRQIFFDTPKNNQVENLREVNAIEWINLIILSAMIIFLGVYPQIALQLFHATTEHLLQLSLISKGT